MSVARRMTADETELVIVPPPETKGDLVGHPFRGNQWTGGHGGTATAERPRIGVQLRELVTPLTLDGRPINDGNTYAVTLNNGEAGADGQAHLFIEADVAKRDRPTDVQIQRALSTLADLREQYPLTGGAAHLSHTWIAVVGRQRAVEETGTYTTAYVAPLGTSPQINLVAGNAWTTGMKSYTAATDVESVVAHEYGHLRESEVRPGSRVTVGSMYREAMAQTRTKDNPGGSWKVKDGLTKYGQTNAHEAFAEAHADFVMNRDEARPSSKAYAEAFGWK